MRNQRYIKILLLWCIAMSSINAQADYCSESIFLCYYTSSTLEGNGEMVGPFNLSTYYFPEIEHEFDGQDLHIRISTSFFQGFNDSLKIEDIGAGTECKIPFFFEYPIWGTIEDPDIECIQYNYFDPSLDQEYNYNHGKKFNFCVGDKTTYTLTENLYNLDPSSYYLTEERLTQSLGEITYLDSVSFDISYNKAGYELMELYTTTSIGCNTTLYYPVEVRDTIVPQIGYEDSTELPTSFCKGENIKLTSLNGNQLRWKISNGATHFGNSFNTSFEVPGTYQITVTELGECDCSQPAVYTITIDEAITPTILCTGTLCDGGEVTYYATEACDEYEWSISQGTITGGGGLTDDFVTVLWSDATTGSITLGTPSCANGGCSEVTIKEIPIIDANAPIIGKDSICTGETSVYSIPNYNGTTFQWSVSEGGYIIDGENEHKVTIKWNEGTVRTKSTVSVVYDNCDINCQGYSEKIVTIQPVFDLVFNQEEYCVNSDIVVTNNLGDLANYTIITPYGDTLKYFDIDTLTYFADTIGSYKIDVFATRSGICNPSIQTSLFVESHPDPITDLKGPRAICKSLNVTYSVDIYNSDETVFWEVFDGDLSTPLFSTTSLELDYIWKSDGPYQITATKFNTITGCSSESSDFELHSNHKITGPDSSCLQTTYEYAYNGKPVSSSNWQIIPDEAGIITGVYQNTVSIVWQLAGNHTIAIEQCDKLTEFDVYVEPVMELIHNIPSRICRNDSVLVNFSTSLPASFSVTNNYGDTLATELNPSGLLTHTGYTFSATSDLGCSLSEYYYIGRQNPPKARIKLNGPSRWCPPGSTQLEARNYNSVLNRYQWYRDGNIIQGATGRYYNTSQFGAYTLKVTNKEYGCSATSTVLTLSQCCGNESPPANSNEVEIEETMITCNTRMFEAIPPFKSSTFSWKARRLNSIYNMGVGTDVTYTFPSAGVYVIYATGDSLCQYYDIVTCGQPDSALVCEGGQTLVTIPGVANFSYKQICGGNTIKFNETSSKLNSFQFTYHWDFGDGNTSTTRHPSHTYNEAGSFTATLTLTHTSGCTTTKSRTIYVREKPKITIETNNVFCLDSYVRFYPQIESGSSLQYRWNFGDPSSGTSNTSSTKNPYHKFSSAGTYTVTLRVEDPNDCYDVETITVTIGENNLDGQIGTDKIYPKCPDEIVTLTAPPATFYSWVGGDTSQQIQVMAEGNYQVTIYDEFGCSHATNLHFVDDYVFQPIKQYARIYNKYGHATTHYDSIELCHGDRFDLEASFLPESQYFWTGHTNEDNKLEFEDGLNVLTPGRYEFFTRVREIPKVLKIQIALQKAGYSLGPNGADGALNVDTQAALEKFQNDNGITSGEVNDSTLTALNIFPCEVETGPFIVIIRPSPDVPIIDSDLTTNCEGQLSTMTVSNVNSHQEYEWSTGIDGIEITAFAAGEYQVTTTDTLGCISSSEAIEIFELPEVSAWMTGCREVCFPEEICIDLRPEFAYTLIRDGEEIGTIDANSFDLAIDSIGEYQLMATNSDGCSITSDLLVLTKTPDDHDLSGIVYYDENGNNIHDTNELLFEDVPVYLMEGDNIVAETVTDENGFYEFLDFEEYDLYTIIDETVLNYILAGVTDHPLQYETCVEEKQIDFPLINNCQQIPMNIEEHVCSGETIIIDGIAYGEYDTDTLIYQKALNCDSIVYLNVLPFPIPEIETSTIATCKDEEVGSLQIHLISGDSISFSIDTGQELVQDSIIENLSVGSHTLYVHSKEGCIYPHVFEILEMPVPSLTLDIEPTCIGKAEGLATLSVTAMDSLYYTIDQGQTYTDQLLYEDLTAGSYEVWAIDSLGCIYEAPFEITNFEEPELDLSFSNSCEGEENGSIEISIKNNVETEFRLYNDTDWMSDISFDGLSAGDYTLYSRSEFGCLDTSEFTITTIPSPDIGFILTEECYANTLGNIQVFTDLPVTFSLDGEHFGNEGIFDSISAGVYTIYVQDEFLCMYEYPIEVPLIPSPEIELIPSTTCKDEAMGTMQILDNSNHPFVYSLDNLSFSADLQYDGLEAGTYNLYAENEIGCVYAYEFEIIETLPPEVDLTQDDSCPNDDTGIVYLTTSAKSDIVYLNSELENTERTFEGLAPGLYEVEVEDSLGCTTLDEIEIFEFPPLLAEMPILDADCYENELTILPIIESHQGTVHYEWSDGTTSDHLSIDKRGQYAVTISDECDALVHDWEVYVLHNATEDQLYTANIFTPNNDGFNDCFNVVVDSDLEIVRYRYVIFDRWGNKMFETTETSDCWDGQFNGEPVEQGVYVVISEATVIECTGSKNIRKVSDVTVIR